jgi:small-conductance mechanosensitive channel
VALLALAAALAVAPAARAAGALEPEWVHLRDEKVVRLQAAQAGRTARQRAEEANRALAAALEAEPAPARLVPGADVVVIQVGPAPVLALDAEDARLARAASLEVHAAEVAARIDAAMRSERRRASVAGMVFQVSLLVFAGLLAWLLLRRLSTLERQLERWLAPRPDARTLTVAGVDVTHAAAPPALRTLVLRLARLLAQLVVIWIWVLFALSLFPESRQASERLLHAVVQPAFDLAGRLAGALPGLVTVALIAALAVAGVRTLRLLFDQAARGEATLPLVAPDRALAVGRLSQAAVVLLAVVLASPLLASGEANVLGRLGEAALLTLALALVPLAASAMAGLPHLLGGPLRPGDRVELAGRTGRIVALGVLGLELEEPDGPRSTVPWLLTLLHPVRRLPRAPVEGARDR